MLTPKLGIDSSFQHEELWKIFTQHKPSFTATTRIDRDIWRIGYLLRQVKDLRVNADYISADVYSRNNAVDAVKYSEEIMNLSGRI